MTFRHLFFILFLFTGGCATAPTDPVALAEYEKTNDPIEPFNRAVFAFNMQADTYVMRPIIKGYRYVAPEPLRKNINNFFDNLNAPITLANNLLQGRFKQASVTIARAAINFVAGFFGFYDVAAEIGLEKQQATFAQTLGVWGVPSGPYLVLPLLGPADVRSTVGMGTDLLLTPLTYAAINTGNKDLEFLFWADTIFSGIARYDAAADLLDDLRKNSIDSYAAMRSMYQQYRDGNIARLKGENVTKSDASSFEFSLDDFDDE